MSQTDANHRVMTIRVDRIVNGAFEGSFVAADGSVQPARFDILNEDHHGRRYFDTKTIFKPGDMIQVNAGHIPGDRAPSDHVGRPVTRFTIDADAPMKFTRGGRTGDITMSQVQDRLDNIGRPQPAARPSEPSIRPLEPGGTPVFGEGGRTSPASAHFNQAAHGSPAWGRALSIGGRVLGVAGVALATFEVAGLNNAAHAAVTNGQMPAEALGPYQAFVAGAVGSQAAAGLATTIAAGPVIDAAWDKFADQYGLSPEMREALKPSTLNLTRRIQLDDQQRAFFDIYQGLPAKVEGGMPPEVAALAGRKEILEAERAREAAFNARPGAVDIAQKTEIQNAIAAAETAYERQYNELSGGGGLAEVASYLNEQPRAVETAAASPGEKPVLSRSVAPALPAMQS